MPRIKSVTLTDFGRHKRVHAKFDGYVVGLTGSNGLGKSTVLQALQLAYTGTIETSPAEPLVNFIRRSSGENPPKFAEVESEFEADGKSGRIIRRITRTTVTRKLYWGDSDKPITSDKEVNDIMSQLWGVDRKAINSTVFIRQGEMASMFGQETDRRDFYTRLLMLGHLAKVANVIETHRAHMAETVQDLGAVRDAAQVTYDEASAFYEDALSLFESRTSPAQELATARRMLGLYEAQTAAALDADREAQALDAILKSEGSRQTADERAASLRSEIQAAQDAAAALLARKNAHIKASTDMRAAEHSLFTIRKLTDLFAEKDTLEAELSASTAAVTAEDPGPRVDASKQKLKDLERLEDLTARVSLRQSETDGYTLELGPLRERLGSAMDRRDQLRADYATVKNWANAKRTLLVALKDHAPGDGRDCPLCHTQNVDVDVPRLQADVDAEMLKLDALLVDGQAAAAEVDRLLADVDAKQKLLDVGLSEIATMNKEAQRLRFQLALSTRESIEADLGVAREDQRHYVAAWSIRRSLLERVERNAAAIGSSERPSAEALSLAEMQLAAATRQMETAAWGGAEEAMEREIKATEDRANRELTNLVARGAALTAALERVESTSSVLTAALADLPKGFYADVLSASGILTEAEAAAKVERLTADQQFYDEAKGRKDAANESLKAASRKIDEIDLRIREQKHRLDLVKDLEALRDTFKPAGASLDFLNYKFGQIAQMAADYLAEGGADFMVAPSEEIPLSFDFLRTDRDNEVWMPQNRLSGGQKVRLAVATLRAIHAMVMPNVGLLVLDEPTTHLDDEAKRAMADMLRTIGEEKTLQLIVCDHSPILIDAFSDLIEIQE